MVFTGVVGTVDLDGAVHVPFSQPGLVDVAAFKVCSLGGDFFLFHFFRDDRFQSHCSEYLEYFVFRIFCQTLVEVPCDHDGSNCWYNSPESIWQCCVFITSVESNYTQFSALHDADLVVYIIFCFPDGHNLVFVVHPKPLSSADTVKMELVAFHL